MTSDQYFSYSKLQQQLNKAAKHKNPLVKKLIDEKDLSYQERTFEIKIDEYVKLFKWSKIKLSAELKRDVEFVASKASYKTIESHSWSITNIFEKFKYQDYKNKPPKLSATITVSFLLDLLEKNYEALLLSVFSTWKHKCSSFFYFRFKKLLADRNQGIWIDKLSTFKELLFFQKKKY